MSKVLFLVCAICLLQSAYGGNIKKYEDLFTEFKEKFAQVWETKSDSPYVNYVKEQGKSYSDAYEVLFTKLAKEARASEAANEIVQPIVGKLLDRANKIKEDFAPENTDFGQKFLDGLAIVERKYTLLQTALNEGGDEISADIKDTVKQILDLTEQTTKRINDKKTELGV